MIAVRIDRGVVASVLKRELGWRRLAVSLAVAGVFGVLSAAGTGNAPSGAVLEDPSSFFDAAQPLLFGYLISILLVYVVIERLVSDHDNGWANPLYSLGGSRHRYVLAVLLGAFVYVVLIYLAGIVGFAITRAIGGGSFSIRSYARIAIRLIFFLASTAVFGSFWALVFRGRMTALVLAAGSVVGPLVAWRAMGGVPGQTHGLKRMLFVHLPPRIEPAVATTVVNQLIYTCAGLLLVMWISNRVLNRYS